MGENQGQKDFVDLITGFVMKRTSRRSILKWLGKGGLALTTGLIGGFEFFQHVVFASFPCSKYLPGCMGDCTCFTGRCTDLDNGKQFSCTGACVCPNAIFYYVDVFWYWDPTLQKCVQAYDCVPCGSSQAC